MLIVPCRLAVRDSHWSTTRSGLAAPSVFCLWSLLTFYHNSNNLIMMLPAFVFLLLVDDPGTVRQRWFSVALLQIVLMFDVPTRLGAVAPALGGFRVAILDFDRLVVLLTFVYIVILWHALRRSEARGDGDA
jgi:hypothetical protein